MPDYSGQNIGRYHLIASLGEGGMAVVYRAYDTRLECDVAVKFIRMERLTPELAEKTLKRFEREAKVVAQLTQSHVVKVMDYGEYQGVPYLVMEYLPGGTLKRLIGKPLAYGEAAHLLAPVARALEYAHAKGVLHRDVKPSNILITQDGEPMLTDFGVAKLLEGGEGQTLTGTGVGVGTPEYMAPEQVLGKAADARADVYALGIVLYELVTGCKPFTADTPLAVLLKQVNEPLPRPRQYDPGLPDQVEKVISKALAKKPEERYQSMGEFATALEKLEYGETNKQETIESAKTQNKIPGLEEDKTTDQVILQMSKRTSQSLIWRAVILVTLVAVVGLLAWTGWSSIQPGQLREQPAVPLVISASSTVLPAKSIVAITSTTAVQQDLLAETTTQIFSTSSVTATISPTLSSTAIPTSTPLVNAIVLKNIDRIQALRRLQGAKGSINCLSFSPDSKLLAAAGISKIVYVWSVEDGKLLYELDGNDREVKSLAFSSDGKLLASGGLDETARLWDVGTGNPIHSLLHDAGVVFVQFFDQDRLIASGGMDGVVKKWSVADSALEETIGFPVDQNFYAAQGFALSPDQETWSIQAAYTLQDTAQTNQIVKNVIWSPGKDANQYIYNFERSSRYGSETGAFSNKTNLFAVLSYAWQDCREFMRGSACIYEGKFYEVDLFDILQEKRQRSILGVDQVLSMDFSADDRLLAATVQSGVLIWDVETGKELADLKGFSSRTMALTFSLGGEYLAGADYSGNVWLWGIP